ncbi:hypothetical protein MAR_001471 [Mya arenaria]|uniref:Galactose oxidase n=1 Tax=Mya arenaria TaxID=6604 RepID=A0ABY7FBU4_MYAAR|nr:hypothetical protein MAR_001471 [Mya arenaria]
MLSYIIFGLCTCVAYTQDISWTWLSGKAVANEPVSKDQPGGRSGAAFWQQKDKQALWLFGGETPVGHDQPSVKNDLWRFSHGQWSLVNDGQSPDAPPGRQLAAACGLDDSFFVLFGGLGNNPQAQGEKVEDQDLLGDTWIFGLENNKWYTLEEFQKTEGAAFVNGSVPEARGDMAFWCQPGDTMSIFGGFGKNKTLYHDLWTFDLKTLKWEESTLSVSIPDNSKFASHLEYPTARSGSTTWIVGKRLFLWGGNILPTNFRKKHLMIGNTGDLWEYNQTSDTWAYRLGPRIACTTPGKYGEQGTADAENMPGCRRRAAAWVDIHGNLWMFGGDGVDDSQESVSVFKHSKLLSDVWHFDTVTFLWTWKGGSQQGEQKGVFGDIGQHSSDAHPGSRCEPVVWDSSVYNDEERRERKYFYIFGGVGHDLNGHDGYLNDVWMFDTNMDTSVLRNAPYAGPSI